MEQFIMQFLIDGLLVCAVGVGCIGGMCWLIWKGMEKLE